MIRIQNSEGSFTVELDDGRTMKLPTSRLDAIATTDVPSTSSSPASSDLTPQYTPAYKAQEIKELPLSAGFRPVRVGRYPSVSPILLGHLELATGVPAGSRSNIGAHGMRMVPDMDYSDDANGPSAELAAALACGRAGGINLSSRIKQLLADVAALGCDAFGVPKKAVVFSQHRAAIKHVDLMLWYAKVPHVTIVRGDPQTVQEAAVEAWNTRSSCRVFLLHAGAAAAGLTLVAAQHVFLLEPFDVPGQELQALNRCHRIGQTEKVSCTVYYAPRTAEERLLAYRNLERGGEPSKCVGPEDLAADEAVCTLAEGSTLPSRDKWRYLFGMLLHCRANADGDEHHGEDDETEDESGEAGDDGSDMEEESELSEDYDSETGDAAHMRSVRQRVRANISPSW